jgi:hypothetical protein
MLPSIVCYNIITCFNLSLSPPLSPFLSFSIYLSDYCPQAAYLCCGCLLVNVSLIILLHLITYALFSVLTELMIYGIDLTDQCIFVEIFINIHYYSSAPNEFVLHYCVATVLMSCLKVLHLYAPHLLATCTPNFLLH